MEIASIDEYGPQSDPAGMGAGHGHVQGVGIGVPTGRHSSASPLTNEDDNMSDREDDGSGEELPQQPLQNNSHSSNPLGAPDEHPEPSVSPLARPHFMDSYLAKIKVEPPTSEPSNVSITSKSSLEAFQAAMANGFQLPLHFNPAFLAGAGAPGAPSLPSHLQSHMPFVFRDAAGLAGMPPGNAPGTPGSNGNGPVIGTPGNAPGNNPQQQMSSNSSNISEESTGSQKDSKSGILAQGQITPTGTGGQSQQPNNWSFEEQFKQLYEINNDPKRKEFLDDLFSFMQKKGTPINRLPIMAKQVLDLYELYNLVITRGGLVEVINKKMWQEIIKGLHLPSSITSAAFTLRTQYMKYLYPYECAKLKLSTDSELQSAIDGNRREGRRTTYGTPMGYQGSPGDMLQHTNHRIHGNPQGLVGMQGLPMSLVNAVSHAAATNRADHEVSSHHLLNGSGVHAPMPHHPHATPGQTPSLQTEQLTEYLQMMLQSRLPQVERTAMAIAAENQNNRPDSTSPNPEGRSPVHHSHMPDPNIIRSLNLFSAMQYQNRAFPLVQHATSPEHQLESPPAASPEPQREALDLGLRTSSNSSSPEHHSPPAVASSSISLKRDIDQVASPATMNYKKANLELEHSQQENNTPRKTHITNRERDNSMAVSMEVNGVLYEGVLYPKQRNQNNGTSRNGSSNNDNDTSRDAS